jgi:DNA-binding winged helix-turn-helix (wHTH) protein
MPSKSSKPVDGSATRVISFGPFSLLPDQRQLLEVDKLLNIGSRAFDILLALVERPGELISKEELMTRVWPNVYVEPANLTVHVAALRRVLGDGREGHRYLVNIPGRGYRFVAPVSLEDRRSPRPPQQLVQRHSHNLPNQITRLLGRAETARALATFLSSDRLLTVEHVAPENVLVVDDPDFRDLPRHLGRDANDLHADAAVSRPGRCDIGVPDDQCGQHSDDEDEQGLLPSVRGDLLHELGLYEEARAAFEAAAALAGNRREHDLLRRRAADAADAATSS